MGGKLPFVSNGLRLPTSRLGRNALNTCRWDDWDSLSLEQEELASLAQGKWSPPPDSLRIAESPAEPQEALTEDLESTGRAS